jgi:hypothetical protein
MLKLNARIRDLADPYKYEYIKDPRAPGRWSLKIVMPLLFPAQDYPGLDYSRLEIIHEGGAAQKLWMQTVLADQPSVELDGIKVNREQVLESLRKYCTLDTLSMVFILEKYNNWVKR